MTIFTKRQLASNLQGLSSPVMFFHILDVFTTQMFANQDDSYNKSDIESALLNKKK